MSATATATHVCRSCGEARDDLGRRFTCDTWLCACGRTTATALRSVCNVCDVLPEEPTVTTVYGQPAVEIEQPGGDVVPYVIAEVAADAEEWRAWQVTSPEGKTYRVSEYPDGRTRCDCPATLYNRHGAGRWCEIATGAKVCKHARSLYEQVIKSEGVQA